MIDDDNSRLTALAGAILDGTPVDWQAADAGATRHDRPLVRQLKAIAAIVQVHRADTPDRWGPLRLLDRIGRGAFGEVYRAWDPRLDREVALKLVQADPSASPPRAPSIIEEGRLLARVRHPNVVIVHGAERIDDRVGLWMEYIDGRTLHQLVVHDGRRFSPREVAAMGQALCGAVAAVHGAGLLHRDIKAQNVMMGRDGRVVLMDFGSGRDRGGTSGADLVGTPLFLAPEVMAGTRSPSVQSDIYSTGVVLFFLLTGTYPVTGVDLSTLREAHARGERHSLNSVAPGVPRRLRRCVERAIDPRPERRYESADALGADLAALTRGGIVRLASALLTSVAESVGAANLSPAERPILAVLPFKNLGAESVSDYFVEGLTDEIIRKLAPVQGLHVVSRTSSFAFKAEPHNLRHIKEQLGANLVVEGSVLRAGRRLQITARLVQVAGEFTLWAERFDGELEDVFSIQDDISGAIINKIGLTPGRERHRYDTNLDAHDLYLRGRALAARRGMANAQQAVELRAQNHD